MSTLDKKVCLCMIVKNESKIIERCLNSAKSILDYVSICDTGSTDQTPEIIENWCSQNNIPGKVHHEPFVNFGYNRSLAVTLAQKSFPDADYLLLLDADMILVVNPEFDKNSLEKDQYLTMQDDGGLKYWLTRFIKAPLPWHSVGVTHEYWDVDHSKLDNRFPFQNTVGKLDSIYVIDEADGGSRSDKFQRDKQLLLEGLADPSTPDLLKTRYTFYLAQTYMCLGEYEKAIKWYKERVEAGGWAEEVFYSLLQIGHCYEQLANILSKNIKELQEGNKSKKEIINQLKKQEEEYFAASLLYFQNAWEYRPVRAEPLYHLARMCRIRSKNHLGLLYALQGKEIPFPSNDILFVDYHVYDYLFDYEISICAYYWDEKFEIGRKSQKFLESIIEQLPEHIAKYVKFNSKFY